MGGSISPLISSRRNSKGEECGSERPSLMMESDALEPQGLSPLISSRRNSDGDECLSERPSMIMDLESMRISGGLKSGPGTIEDIKSGDTGCCWIWVLIGLSPLILVMIGSLVMRWAPTEDTPVKVEVPEMPKAPAVPVQEQVAQFAATSGVSKPHVAQRLAKAEKQMSTTIRKITRDNRTDKTDLMDMSWNPVDWTFFKDQNIHMFKPELKLGCDLEDAIIRGTMVREKELGSEPEWSYKDHVALITRLDALKRTEGFNNSANVDYFGDELIKHNSAPIMSKGIQALLAKLKLGLVFVMKSDFCPENAIRFWVPQGKANAVEKYLMIRCEVTGKANNKFDGLSKKMGKDNHQLLWSKVDMYNFCNAYWNQYAHSKGIKVSTAAVTGGLRNILNGFQNY